VKFEALDQEGKADYLLLKNHLDRVEHRSAVDEAQWKEVEPLLLLRRVSSRLKTQAESQPATASRSRAS